MHHIAFDTGIYSVVVKNPDGGWFALRNSLTISAPIYDSQPASIPDAPQQESNPQSLQQEKANQINALVSQYQTQYDALQQQIIDIKNKYYATLNTLQNDEPGQTVAQLNAGEQYLLNNANSQISQIQVQEQQLYLNYQEKINALH